MAFLSKHLRLRPISTQQLRNFSSILNPDSKTPLTSKEKSRAALSLIKSEKNPERIIEICRAASLTPESHLDRVAFSIAISKLTESNYFEGIRQFLEELKTRPDLKTERFLSHAIVLYGESGLIDDAVQTFEGIHELGVDRTAKSLNALLFSCVLAKKYSEVNRIFLEFPKKYGIEVNLDCYNTVIKSFCESGFSNSVFSILSEMDRKGIKPNLTTFGTIIAGFYKEEKFDEVEKVLRMMKGYNVHPSVGIFNTRIQSLCKLKRSNEAKALLDGIVAMGFKPNSESYSNLIFGFCNEGKMDEAKGLFKEMGNRRCKMQSGCYFTMVHFLCKNGDFETALQFCKESMEKGWVPNLTTMKTLVNGLASISKVDEARELAGQMKEKFPNYADTWTQVEEALPS